MHRRAALILAAAIGLSALGGAGHTMQSQLAERLRASGQAGEQPDGYLGVVGNADAAVRQQVSSVNIKRRALYTDLARRRQVQVDEVAATMACEILATRVQPGQYYRLIDGTWRRRRQGEAVIRPSYCI